MNPSLRIQERQEFKNETVIKNSRSFFIFPLHSRYFSFRNEPIIKNSRTNPSSRIQHYQEFTRLRECKTGTKNEPVIKNSRTNPSSRIQDRFLYSRYIPVTFLLGTNPSSRIQERTRHQEFKIKERDYECKTGTKNEPVRS